MPFVFRIAIRNLKEHKVKTLIIGILIAMGILVLVVGNSFVETAAEGIRRGFIDNYTGHIFIHGEAEGDVSLFGVQSPGGIEETPTIPNFERVTEYLSKQDEIENYTPQITGFSSASIDDYDGRQFTLLFGINPNTYRRMFNTIEMVEGEYLTLGKEGILLSEDHRDRMQKSLIEETAKKREEEVTLEIEVGDIIRLTSFSNAGIKIREVPVAGIFKHTFESQGLGSDLVSFVDVQTIRSLMAMTIPFQGEFELRQDETALLSEDVIESDELFSGDIFDEEEEPETKMEDYDDILGDISLRSQALETDIGSWNFILIKLKNSRDMNGFIKKTNEWFEQEGISAVAENWEEAAGPFATTADVVRTVFNIAIAIVGVVAVIIMMNTLVISVMERTSEIGTMRALGAQKGFIWKMFFAETFIIALLFGIIGVLLSFLTVYILGMANIEATNVFLRILFAGPTLNPDISGLSVLWGLIIVTGIAVLAHIYPVTIALKIQPIRAIQSE
jgi:putative ABC transport system permease protein